MIEEQCTGHGAKVDQVVPVAVVPSQTRGFERQHRTHFPGAYCGQQTTEARPLDGASSGAALVFIDDHHTLEAERVCPFPQIILASLSFQARAHLLHCRLPDIDAGLTLNVTRLDLLADRSPPRRWLGLCSRLSAASDLVTRGNAVAWPPATAVCGESPREGLPGVVDSRDAPPGEDASEAIAPEGSGVRGCASIRSRNDRRAVIARAGRSTISIPKQRSPSSIHS